MKRGAKCENMTLEEKGAVALKYFREFGKCTRVSHVGRWRGKDVFSNATPEKPEEVVVGNPYSVLISDSGKPEFVSLEIMFSPDFPSLSGED